MIWCAVSGNGVLGPYFIEDVDCVPLTVTQEHYRNMVVRPFIQVLGKFCPARKFLMNRLWFQQDGVICHTARQSVAMLQETFPGRIISHGTEFPYPSHSPDLTPPDMLTCGEC